MQLGGTTKYVATKFRSGSGQKLAMLRKLPEVSCSDLRPLEPWCHGVSHGARVGMVVPCLGMASHTYKDAIPTLIMTVPLIYTLLCAILLMAVGRWSSNGGWRRVCGSD